MNLTEERLRAILSEELDEQSTKLFTKLSELGLDLKDPLAQQADMRHLRKWRTALERSGLYALSVTFATIVMAIGTALWAAATGVFHK